MNKGCLWHSRHNFFSFVLGDHFFSVTAPSSLIIFRVLPINLGELASFSIQSCSHKSPIWVCVKLYSMGPSVIINTFIFYNCCFLHAQTSSLLGPQGPGGTSVCPHANTPPRPVGSVPALCAGLRPTICQMPAGSALCRRGERNQTHSRPCVQQVTFQTVSKRALDPETSKLQCFHCLNQPSEKTHVCTIWLCLHKGLTPQ